MMLPKKKMRHDNSCLKFGFTVIKSNGEEKPQCVLCSIVLVPTSSKPSKLKRHLEKPHPNLLSKDVDFFKQKAETLIKSRLNDKGMFWKDIMGGLKVSYKVSHNIDSTKSLTTLEKS